MRRILPFAVSLLFLALAGCSNAPVAGLLDNCCPSRARATPNAATGSGVDVRPNPDPIRPGPAPAPGPGPLPPPDFGANP